MGSSPSGRLGSVDPLRRTAIGCQLGSRCQLASCSRGPPALVTLLAGCLLGGRLVPHPPASFCQRLSAVSTSQVKGASCGTENHEREGNDESSMFRIEIHQIRPESIKQALGLPQTLNSELGDPLKVDTSDHIPLPTTSCWPASSLHGSKLQGVAARCSVLKLSSVCGHLGFLKTGNHSIYM